MNNSVSHSTTITVRPSETNSEGILRTDAAANYMEDIAGQHADILGVGLQFLLQHGISWAMAKMRIQFYRRPEADETIRLETRPYAGPHHTFLREFNFIDNQNQLCISAMTRWVVFDLETRKMTALPDSLNSFPQNDKPGTEDTGVIASIKNHPGKQAGPAFPVRLSDIDQNNHVNNVRYLSFVEEAGQVFFQQQATLQTLEVAFRAESCYGEIINSATAPESQIPATESSLLHSLSSGGKELLRGRTTWKQVIKN